MCIQQRAVVTKTGMQVFVRKKANIFWGLKYYLGVIIAL